MDYTIKLSFAMHGDVVPLAKVAEVMSMHKASGGGEIPWHKDTYHAMKHQYEDLLLDAVTKGSLVVCNQFGKVETVREIVDAQCTNASNSDYLDVRWLNTKAHHLNQWAATNGDAFTLKDTGVDVFKSTIGIGTLESEPAKTFYESPPAQKDQTEAMVTASDKPAPLPAVPNWKMQIQAEATALCLRLRKAGANPTKHSILEAMAKWCRENDVLTDGNIYPSEGYIRTHVLGGKHWEVPR